MGDVEEETIIEEGWGSREEAFVDARVLFIRGI